jgi:CHAD domain-containing protein
MARSGTQGDRDAARSADADLPLAVVGAATLRQQFEKLRAREEGTRQGEDVEALHQMRVANSRLRVALRVFVTDAVREPFADVEAGASELAQALGAVRDLDVFREELRARAEQVSVDAPAIGSLLEALDRVRVVRRAELIAVLDGRVARRMEKEFPKAVDALEQTAANRETVASDAPRLINKRLKKVVR